jgi:hypothetical protein
MLVSCRYSVLSLKKAAKVLPNSPASIEADHVYGVLVEPSMDGPDHRQRAMAAQTGPLADGEAYGVASLA